MAACEKCGATGFSPYQMLVDPEKQIFVGPCCTTSTSMPGVGIAPRAPARQEVPDYGIQISNKTGVHAYVNYGGLALTFDKSYEELRAWALETGLVTEIK